MKYQRAASQLHYVLHYMTLVMLILSVEVTGGSRKSNCHNRLDIVLAVDTTSSESPSKFDQVKSEVKSIVSGFTIGQDKVRLALISMSKNTKRIVNFNEVNSVSDFNTAVDTLKFSTDVADVLSSGMKLARNSVLSTARSDVSRILILVKDRRSRFGDVSSASVLSRMAREAAGVKATECAITLVGIGGLWNRLEIEAAFGTDYNLFTSQHAALSFVKSLNNVQCTIDYCPRSNPRPVYGLCYGKRKYAIQTVMDSVKRSYGMVKCEKKIERRFVRCSKSERCMRTERKIGPCRAGKLTIENRFWVFNYRSQSCISWRDPQEVKCEDKRKCNGQVADIIFLLDKSATIGHEFYILKMATKEIIESLTMGPNNVRVGVFTFSSASHSGSGRHVDVAIQLGSIENKEKLIGKVNGLSTTTGGSRFTHEALKLARKTLTGDLARKSIGKFVILITDGASSDPFKTFEETAALKNAGITVYAFGVGSEKKSELEIMTAPDTKTNLYTMKELGQLPRWAQTFSKESCIRLSSPSHKLCEINAHTRSISDCTHGQRMITETKYQYDEAKKCVKFIQTSVQKACKLRSKNCVDPINGNDVIDGHNWENLCHNFHCMRGSVSIETKKCLAADGSCREPGSRAFDCTDERGRTKTNCRCVESDTSSVAMAIDWD